MKEETSFYEYITLLNQVICLRTDDDSWYMHVKLTILCVCVRADGKHIKKERI